MTNTGQLDMIWLLSQESIQQWRGSTESWQSCDITHGTVSTSDRLAGYPHSGPQQSDLQSHMENGAGTGQSEWREETCLAIFLKNEHCGTYKTPWCQPRMPTFHGLNEVNDKVQDVG